MSFFQEAFDEVCKEAKEPKGSYVCLMEQVQRYIGPEEGGTYANDNILIAYQWFDTEEAAEAAKEAIEKLAEELTNNDRREHGRHCLESMEWLDARGLDADYLPEPDGPSEYYVMVSSGVPSNSYGPTHYE